MSNIDIFLERFPHFARRSWHFPHLLHPVRQWLDQITVTTPDMAHRICHLIPAQCPFERDLMLFGRKLAHIPPLCKLNPLYDELAALRFRAVCYLVDCCGESFEAL